MVALSIEAPSAEIIHPLQLRDGQPVLLQSETRFLKGFIAIDENAQEGFTVEPQFESAKDVPRDLSWNDVGRTACDRLFRRSAA